jgi:hypothetical protein
MTASDELSDLNDPEVRAKLIADANHVAQAELQTRIRNMMRTKAVRKALDRADRKAARARFYNTPGFEVAAVIVAMGLAVIGSWIISVTVGG